MGSFGGSLFQGMAGGIMQAHPILEAIGTVSSSALSGGVGTELTGGDFWRGAATGAIVGLLNHELGKIAKKYILDSEVIILEDTEGAGYKGHMAIATGNDKKGKGWTYVSKYAEMIQGTDGQQEMDGNLVSGGKAKAVCIHYNTKVELLAANSEYDRFITFKTTYYGALNAAKTTYKASIGYYHFMFSNCSHAVANGLNALGLYFGSSIIPNERFEQIYNYYSK